MIKIFVVAVMLLSVCVDVSLGKQLVLDSDISEFSDVVFTTIKPGKFDYFFRITSNKSRLSYVLQVAIGEARDTSMNPSPTESVINIISMYYSICYKCIIIESRQSKKTSKKH